MDSHNEVYVNLVLLSPESESLGYVNSSGDYPLGIRSAQPGLLTSGSVEQIRPILHNTVHRIVILGTMMGPIVAIGHVAYPSLARRLRAVRTDKHAASALVHT